MRVKLVIGLLLITSMLCRGQTNYPTRDLIHIFWQPGLIITFADYKGGELRKVRKQIEESEIKVAACIGVDYQLDFTKKGDQYEKTYIAPVFDRRYSVALVHDSLELAMQRLTFDMREVCARQARQQLQIIKDSTNGVIGGTADMFLTIIQDMEDKYWKMELEFTKEAIVKKSEIEFKRWRKLIDKKLEETKVWCTSPEECYRLMSRKPIEEGFVRAKRLRAPMPIKK